MSSDLKKALSLQGGDLRKELLSVKDRYKFFGEVALEKKLVTTDQLYEALTLQARAKVEGRGEKLLGQVLLELGYLSEDQIRQVLDVLYPVADEK